MTLAGHVTRIREKRNAYRILGEKPEEKIPLVRPRCRWEDNIKINNRAVECGGMDWIYLVQDRDEWSAVVNTVMGLRIA
jgi:hypothetical protein